MWIDATLCQACNGEGYVRVGAKSLPWTLDLLPSGLYEWNAEKRCLLNVALARFKDGAPEREFIDPKELIDASVKMLAFLDSRHSDTDFDADNELATKRAALFVAVYNIKKRIIQNRRR